MAVLLFVAKLAWFSIFVLLWLKGMNLIHESSNVGLFFMVLVGIATLSSGGYAFMEVLYRKWGQLFRILLDKKEGEDEKR